MTKNQWIYKRLRRFRAGIEVGISWLKRWLACIVVVTGGNALMSGAGQRWLPAMLFWLILPSLALSTVLTPAECERQIQSDAEWLKNFFYTSMDNRTFIYRTTPMAY